MVAGFDLFDACVTDATATLFWDKPNEAVPGVMYTVAVDGVARVNTDRTHASLDGLEPERTYHCALTMRTSPDAEPTPLGELDVTCEATKRDIDVTLPPYNAVGDGATMNTAAIQQALDDCDATSRVVIPAGVFLTGALFLHSDSELHVAAGGTLQGSTDPRDYEPWIWSRMEGTERECYASLINIGTLDRNAGYTTHNVRLSGEGSVIGGGATLMRASIEAERERVLNSLDEEQLAELNAYIATCENGDTVFARCRGFLINISSAENVELTGLTFADGPCWNIHPIYSRRVITHGCQIRSTSVWNGDGWDPDSSEDCVLFDTRFDTGDDMVAIKSGKNPEGNEINRPTRRVRVFDCVSSHGHGIALGSEMSGGIEDVRIWDVDIAKSRYGIHIKGTPKRGGYVRNVSVRDCRIAAITIHSVGYNDDGVAGPDQPFFEDYRFERCHVLGRFWGENEASVRPTTAVLVKGFDKPGHEARNIVLRDCKLGGVEHGSGTIELCDCADVRFEGVSAATNPVTDVDRPFAAVVGD